VSVARLNSRLDVVSQPMESIMRRSIMHVDAGEARIPGKFSSLLAKFCYCNYARATEAFRSKVGQYAGAQIAA
jgi:hypothetical protein